MGNSQNSNPIRNMDKRTARREYRPAFEAAISNYRRESASFPSNSSKVTNLLWDQGDIRVCVRKRPFFSNEYDDGEFDVITCLESSNPMKVVIHDARMETDMRRQFMNHHEFTFDRVFNENVSNEAVYDSTTATLVKMASLEGIYATCMVYGQTVSFTSFSCMNMVVTYASRVVGRRLR